MLLISIIESIYIFYMFNYFKTSLYISHPFDVFTKKIKFMDHSNKKNHICTLGNFVGIVLAIWFIVRHFINIKNMCKYNSIIIIAVLIGCIITNINAFIYFLPIFLLEFI